MIKSTHTFAQQGKQGFTLLELVIAIGISALLIAALSVLLTRVFTGNRAIFQNILTTESTRKEIAEISDTLRNARNESTQDWLVLAKDNEIQVRADIDSDSIVETVRYVVEGTTLRRGITEPGGEETIRTVARGLRNLEASVPLFSYYSAEGLALQETHRVSAAVERITLEVINNTDERHNPTGAQVTVDLTPRIEDTPPSRMWPVTLNFPADPEGEGNDASVEITTTDPTTGTQSTYGLFIGDLNDGRLETYSGGHYVNLNYQESIVGSDLPGWYTWVGPIPVTIGEGGQQYVVQDKFSHAGLCLGSSSEDLFKNCRAREVGVCPGCDANESPNTFQKYFPALLIRQPTGEVDYVQNIVYELGGAPVLYPPEIVITNPENYDQFTTSQVIPLDATATDSDGEVVRVEYMLNGSTVAIDTNAADGWQNIIPPQAEGSYTLTATATDNDNLQATAAEPVYFTVGNPSTPTPTPTPPLGNDPWCTISAPNVGQYPFVLPPNESRTTDDYLHFNAHVYVANSEEEPDEVYFHDYNGPIDRNGNSWPVATLIQRNGPLSNEQYEYIYTYQSTQTQWPPQGYFGAEVRNYNDEPDNLNSIEYECTLPITTVYTQTAGPNPTPTSTPSGTPTPTPNPASISVTITNPHNNSMYEYDPSNEWGQNIHLVATVQSQSAIERVEFFESGNLFYTDSSVSGGWTSSWPVSGSGVLEFTAKAYSFTASGTSAPVQVTVVTATTTQTPTPTPTSSTTTNNSCYCRVEGDATQGTLTQICYPTLQSCQASVTGAQCSHFLDCPQ